MQTDLKEIEADIADAKELYTKAQIRKLTAEKENRELTEFNALMDQKVQVRLLKIFSAYLIYVILLPSADCCSKHLL